MNRVGESRRAFLRRAAAVSGVAGAAGAPLALHLAALGNAAAADAGDYKAIVCLFLLGGNDAANMVLPTDADSWATYISCRSLGPEPIALKAAGTPADGGASPGTPAALGGVLPITPRYVAEPANSSRSFAFHPCMPEATALFAAGRLAVVANVGSLIQPVSREDYQLASAPLPAKLFSHNDQANTWQALGAEARIGWGGLLGDLVAGMNSVANFTSISVAGNAAFTAGRTVLQYQVGKSGAVAVAGLDGPLFGSDIAARKLRAIVTAERTHLLAREHALVTKRSIEAQAAFQAAFDVSKVPAPTAYLSPATSSSRASDLAAQLQTVARIVGARGGLDVRRQVFYVTLGGFDTHDNQSRTQSDLMARLSHGLDYFDKALGALGLCDSVVLFTASDFGRSFASNGDGTDHGWGSHHFVLGGANVRGGDIYGRFPSVGIDHPDAVNGGSFLPAISVEQLGATIGRWFGAGSADLDAIFPNLRNFGSRDLGFMAV